MCLARSIMLIASLACARAASATPPCAIAQGGVATPANDWSAQRAQIVEANAALTAGDYARARALAAELVAYLLARPESEHDAEWLGVLDDAGRAAYNAQDAPTASAAWKRVLEVRSVALPDDHPALQWVRGNLAVAIKAQGDLAGARALEEKVLEVRSAALPDDHPDLQRTRGNLVGTLAALGDLAGARALAEKVLDVYSRTLPDEHPELQKARQNLAGMLRSLGDLAGARALAEKVLEVRSRTLPDDHPDLQAARQNLAGIVKTQGDLASACALEEKVLAVRSRTLPDDHPDLQAARGNLAVTLKARGDLAGARALAEKVLEVCLRTFPDDHPHVQAARQNLASTIKVQGDLAGARELEEKVLEVDSRTLPDDHPDLQLARQNLADTIKAQGDLAGARALEEKVLGVRSRTLPDDHPDLQRARRNLAVTIAAENARASAEEVRSEREGGRESCFELITACCRSQTRAARLALLESSPREAEARSQSQADGLDFALSFAAGLGALARLPGLDRPCFVLSETTRGGALASAALMRVAASSSRYRDLRGRLAEQSDELAKLASMGTTSEEFHATLVRRESVERELVTLAKEMSGGTSPAPELDVDALAATLEDHAALVAFRRYERWRIVASQDDKASRESRTEHASSPNAPPLVSSFSSLCAFVLRRDSGSDTSATAGGPDSRTPSSAPDVLARVDLGPIEPIEAAVRTWRAELGVVAGRGIGAAAEPAQPGLSESGDAIRRLVFDPLAERLVGAERVVLVPDDVLHLIPFDALPQDATSRELLGDRLRIETRATVTELMSLAARREGLETLVAVGDVEFDARERASEVDAHRPSADAANEGGASIVAHSGAAPSSTARVETSRTADARRELPHILRGASFGGFTDLPATGAEVDALAASFARELGSKGETSMLRGEEATRDRLIEEAPRARWLHVATHGWFASESLRSWSDPEPLDKHTGLGLRLSGEEQVKGMSPMLLCGLALAGANLPENEVGRTPGLITAEEIATLDLTRCELAVLSACDTNAGVSRAGQGVASLQKALQMAGARSVITSLWKVPDEATRELMVDFYRRLWVEKKPKWQALREAKLMIRNAKDERGTLKYTTRDWAAWVLTGDPN